LAKDVTNLGRWGNGDVEVGLETVADLPYVMGLENSIENMIQ
jgi:predicted transport protein